MSTSEKIASVVAQFIAADREEDRKRIAELERDNAVLSEIGHDVVEHLGEVCANYDSFTHSKYFGGQPVPKPLVDAVCISWDATHAVLERHREMYNGHRPHCLLENAETQIADLNKQIDELNEKCAALVVENKRLAEYASSNWVDVPPPSDAGCLYPECGPTCRRDCPPSAVETPAVKRTPQVGDKVKFVDGSHHQGTIGEVLFKYDGDAFMVGQGSLKYCGKASDLEVIE